MRLAYSRGIRLVAYKQREALAWLWAQWREWSKEVRARMYFNAGCCTCCGRSKQLVDCFTECYACGSIHEPKHLKRCTMIVWSCR
jgi:hypothetical protein